MTKKQPSTLFYEAWRPKTFPALETGVSLHGHTWHSHESLAFLPAAIKKTYVLPALMHLLEKRYQARWKKELDYGLGYWTSPISPETAYFIESQQIKTYGFEPLISITDHDEIAACKDVVSVEWTAPYKKAIFHVGLHNLPAKKAPQILERLRAATAEEDSRALAKILDDVAALPESLIVLNHPLVDQGRIGHEMHISRVREFLDAHRSVIHALEINALQPKSVNRRVEGIGKEYSLPLISGGDRHGFEPNGAINLTDAHTFGEFAREIREDKTSTILFMPQYHEQLAFRYARNIELIMGEYPVLGPRANWYDRVYYLCPDGVTRSLTEMTAGKNSTMVKTTNRIVGMLGLINYLTIPLPSEPPRVDNNTRER